MWRFVTALALGFVLTAAPARAVLRVYQFTVSTTSGPLTGQSAVGYFSFDTSIIPPGAYPLNQVKSLSLFTGLSFDWDGVHYDTANTQTGSLTFDAAGNLIRWEFGTACIASQGSCLVRLVTPGFRDWSVIRRGFPNIDSFFEYGRPDLSFGFGPETVAPAIVSSPRNVTVNPGTATSFATAISISAVASYQWQVSADGGASFSDLTDAPPYSGSTTPTLSVSAAGVRLNGRMYRAVVTTTVGAITTSPATLATFLAGSFTNADFDGDGRFDIVVWRSSTGTFYWLLSGNGYSYAAAHEKRWGTAGDVPLTGDIDGDGKADLVVWRAGDGTFYWLLSSTNYASAGSARWGTAGDVPMLGDLDGDGKSDLVVWRPGNGTFYWLSSSSEYSPGAARMIQWGSGALGDVPMLGDLDGDTRADLVVWRGPTGFFYWLPSSAGYTYAAGQARQWGTSTLDDVPMIGDLDGDHRGDLAVWRPGSGTFYWLSSRRQFDESASRRWGSGSLGDVPMLRDTDADGRADLIVWRPTGTFYWLTSALDYGDASAGTVNWGAGSVGDVPPG